MSIELVMPSNPPSPLYPLAVSLSQHLGLYQWVSSLHQVAKELELQHQSFQWIFRVVFLWDWLVWSPHSLRDSQEFSSAPQSQGTLKSFLQHHNPKASIFWFSSLWLKSHIPTWLLEKPYLWLYGPLLAKWRLCFSNMLSRFVMAFLPRSKHLWISWLQSLSTVILKPSPRPPNLSLFPLFLFAMKSWAWLPWS